MNMAAERDGLREEPAAIRSQQQRHREGGMEVLVGEKLELGTGSRIWRNCLLTETG